MLYTQSRSAVLQFQGDLTYQACGRHPDLIFILLQMEKNNEQNKCCAVLEQT